MYCAAVSDMSRTYVHQKKSNLPVVIKINTFVDFFEILATTFAVPVAAYPDLDLRLANTLIHRSDRIEAGGFGFAVCE